MSRQASTDQQSEVSEVTAQEMMEHDSVE